MKISRFMFTPFWRLTRWGFIGQAFARIDGGDADYDSVYMIVPMVGEFCWFNKEPRDRSREHAYYCGCGDDW